MIFYLIRLLAELYQLNLQATSASGKRHRGQNFQFQEEELLEQGMIQPRLRQMDFWLKATSESVPPLPTLYFKFPTPQAPPPTLRYSLSLQPPPVQRLQL